MKVGSIGVTLDDVPGLWIIHAIWDTLLVRNINDPSDWKMVSANNFWVLL